MVELTKFILWIHIRRKDIKMCSLTHEDIRLKSLCHTCLKIFQFAFNVDFVTNDLISLVTH
jgi:hypothetical protein